MTRGSLRNLGSLVKVEFLDDSRLAVIKFNDPQRMNTLSVEMGQEFFSAVEALNRRDGLRCAILTGEGKAFSAGGDLDWLLARHKDNPDSNSAIMRGFYKSFLEMRKLKVPLIGCINGAAVGAGLCVAMGGCDVRVAHEKALMGVTFVGLGIHPGMAATHFLPQIVGPATAAEWLLTGKLFTAEEALKKGLVSRISADPMKDAMEIAENVANSAPLAVQATLNTLRRSQESPKTIDESLDREAVAQSETYNTQDLLEGIKALKEKRKPNFIGQ